MADSNLWSSVSEMTTTDLVNSLASQPRTPSNNLDKDAFLQLLITQMKYQDPLNPMDNSEYLSQMAQFTSLEQMQNLNASFSKSQAYAMIGKTVYANYQDKTTGTYEEVTGLVSAVTTKSGKTYLNVDGKEVPLDEVSIVGDDYFTATQLNSIYEGVVNTRDMNFVGKHVQALIMDGENVTGYVEGIVDYVKFNGSNSVLVVGDKEIFPNEVASVSNKPFLIGKTIMANVTTTDEDGETVEAYQETTILGVSIKNNKAYLDVEGASIPIDKINYVMEALQYVGETINYNSYNGVVDSVTIKNGIPYFNIGAKELSYTDFTSKNK